MTTAAEDDNGSGAEKPDIAMEDTRSEGAPSEESSESRKDGKDENAESASTGSSEGKGSGSGGGYSADCSASDQSSDENGDRKDPTVKLSVAALNLHDRAESRSSNSSDGESRTRVRRDSEGKEKRTSGEHKKISKDKGEKHALGIDLPMKSPDTIDLESMMRSKSEEERESAQALQDHRVLPQWNGVRVAHPMDPRIDLSTVTVLQAGIVPGNVPSLPEKSATAGPVNVQDNAAMFSINSYNQLMEVIRPFFQSHGIALHQALSQAEAQAQAELGSDQVDSSEGFTSFFTTTNSGTNSGGTTHSGSPQSSDLDKKPRAVDHVKHDRENENDASSMVVLARVKRKHKRAEDSGHSGNSASSSDKRVRIQDRHDHQRQHEAAERAVYEADANEGSSGSSSLSNVPNQEVPPQQAAPMHIAVPPRIVTDVSSKVSSGTSSNINTSTSGSGSGGNTGSGSNQGSSGSGNEGKGSGEEPAQGDNSGESPVDGSDQSLNKATAETGDPKHNEANREKKLLDKKRKRIEMRREYEAQQQMESSESSDPQVAVVRPGKPVTMDQVLRFSKIARIVIQATPPFLVVHTNAAFARLTGIDSHQAVGQTISSLLSLPEGYHSQETQPQPAEDESNPQGSDVSSNEANQSRYKAFALERLLATSGHGKIILLRVVSKLHQMVGRSVTITKEVSDTAKPGSLAHNKGEQAGQDGSVSSSRKEALQQKTCRAAIAPIVSVSAYMPRASINVEREYFEQPKPKRRKSHSQESEDSTLSQFMPKDHKQRPSSPSRDTKKSPPKLIVTHYLIQLEDAGAKSANNLSTMESLSSNSTSVEARLVGLSKEEYQNQKRAASGPQEKHQDSQEPADDEGGNSESTVPEHVTALG